MVVAMGFGPKRLQQHQGAMPQRLLAGHGIQPAVHTLFTHRFLGAAIKANYQAVFATWFLNTFNAFSMDNLEKCTSVHVAWWNGFLLALTVRSQDLKLTFQCRSPRNDQPTTKIYCCQGHSVGKTGSHRVLPDRHLALLRLPAAMQAFSWRMWMLQNIQKPPKRMPTEWCLIVLWLNGEYGD